jgi:hypothetical protein
MNLGAKEKGLLLVVGPTTGNGVTGVIGCCEIIGGS